MGVVFAGDSGDVDGFSPLSQPLDGPEKALANLAAALAMRGHEVAVFNGQIAPVTAHGVSWHDAATPPPAEVARLAACREPRRLHFAADAKPRGLLFGGPAPPGAM